MPLSITTAMTYRDEATGKVLNDEEILRSLESAKFTSATIPLSYDLRKTLKWAAKTAQKSAHQWLLRYHARLDKFEPFVLQSDVHPVKAHKNRVSLVLTTLRFAGTAGGLYTVAIVGNHIPALAARLLLF